MEVRVLERLSLANFRVRSLRGDAKVGGAKVDEPSEVEVIGVIEEEISKVEVVEGIMGGIGKEGAVVNGEELVEATSKDVEIRGMAERGVFVGRGEDANDDITGSTSSSFGDGGDGERNAGEGASRFGLSEHTGGEALSIHLTLENVKTLRSGVSMR